MKLLLNRSQTNRTSPVFRLHAKIELEGDEDTVAHRYRFDRALLVTADQPGLLRKAMIVGIAITVLATAYFSTTRMDTQTYVVLGIVLGIAVGWFFYDRNRETVYVRDLLLGRYFRCNSVIELARKEAWLGVVTSFLRQVMESAKHWDGTETQDIAALTKQEAKYVVIRGL